jgi:hypothetical protein
VKVSKSLIQKIYAKHKVKHKKIQRIKPSASMD